MLPRPLGGLGNQLAAPWTGLTHRSSWYGHRQSEAAVILADRATRSAALDGVW